MVDLVENVIISHTTNKSKEYTLPQSINLFLGEATLRTHLHIVVFSEEGAFLDDRERIRFGKGTIESLNVAKAKISALMERFRTGVWPELTAIT